MDKNTGGYTYRLMVYGVGMLKVSGCFFVIFSILMGGFLFQTQCKSAFFDLKKASQFGTNWVFLLQFGKVIGNKITLFDLWR